MADAVGVDREAHPRATGGSTLALVSSCLDLDRIAPTRRPDGRPSGWQQWRELLFVHHTAPLEDVRRVVPAELELDPWEGRALLGVVPFRMVGVRPSWAPFGLDFLELNLRTYVHYRGRPGIYFFSLEASSWLAVQAARTGWGLPYHHAAMHSHRVGNRVTYESRRRGSAAMAAYEFEIHGAPTEAAQGTLDHFVLERYLLFTVRRGQVSVGQVHHAPYPAQRATLHAATETLTRAAGLQPTEQVAAVHYAEGVDVEVFGPYSMLS